MPSTGQETRRLHRPFRFSPVGDLLPGRPVRAHWQLGRTRHDYGKPTTGNEIRRFRTGGAATFSPDGGSLLTEHGKAVRLWDVATGRETRRFERDSQPTRAVLAFSPDGKLRRCTTITRRHGYGNWPPELRYRRFAGHSEWIRDAAFSPDGRSILTSGDHTARLWDVATGTETRRFEGHTDYVESMAFSSDGRSDSQLAVTIGPRVCGTSPRDVSFAVSKVTPESWRR